MSQPWPSSITAVAAIHHGHGHHKTPSFKVDIWTGTVPLGQPQENIIYVKITKLRKRSNVSLVECAPVYLRVLVRWPLNFLEALWRFSLENVTEASAMQVFIKNGNILHVSPYPQQTNKPVISENCSTDFRYSRTMFSFQRPSCMSEIRRSANFLILSCNKYKYLQRPWSG